MQSLIKIFSLVDTSIPEDLKEVQRLMRELLSGIQLEHGSTTVHGSRKNISGCCCGVNSYRGEIRTFLESFRENSRTDFGFVWIMEDGLPLGHGSDDDYLLIEIFLCLYFEFGAPTLFISYLIL